MDENSSAQLAALEQRSKSNSHRLDKLEEENIALRQMATSIEVLAKEMEFIRKAQNDTNDRLAVIEQKPATRLDQIVTAVIVAVVGICVGYLFGGMM